MEETKATILEYMKTLEELTDGKIDMEFIKETLDEADETSLDYIESGLTWVNGVLMGSA